MFEPTYIRGIADMLDKLDEDNTDPVAVDTACTALANYLLTYRSVNERVAALSDNTEQVRAKSSTKDKYNAICQLVDVAVTVAVDVENDRNRKVVAALDLNTVFSVSGILWRLLSNERGAQGANLEFYNTTYNDWQDFVNVARRNMTA